MDAFKKDNRGEEKFQPIVYQLPEETVPEQTEAPTTETPTEQTEPTTEKPTEQTEPTTEPTTIPTEETQPQKDTDAEDPTTVSAEQSATDSEKEQPADSLLIAMCIGAAVLIAAIGVIVWLRVKKKP